MTEDQARDSELMGLASLTSSAIGLGNSEALKRLPEQLATSGEACAHLHRAPSAARAPGRCAA
jgi:hypothetical protein